MQRCQNFRLFSRDTSCNIDGRVFQSCLKIIVQHHRILHEHYLLALPCQASCKILIMPLLMSMFSCTGDKKFAVVDQAVSWIQVTSMHVVTMED